MKNSLISLFLILQITNAGTYYVSNRMNNRITITISYPRLTWSKKFNASVTGDPVHFRGRTYPTDITRSSGIRFDTPELNGPALNPICYFKYHGKIASFDCEEASLTRFFIWEFIISG